MIIQDRQTHEQNNSKTESFVVVKKVFLDSRLNQVAYL